MSGIHSSADFPKRLFGLLLLMLHSVTPCVVQKAMIKKKKKKVNSYWYVNSYCLCRNWDDISNDTVQKGKKTKLIGSISYF